MHFLETFNLIYKTTNLVLDLHHSCETALTHMIDKWLKALDKGELVGLILVDFRKAFDLVDHKILLNKLELYKLSIKAREWFTTYLTGRTQKVSIGTTVSKDMVVKMWSPSGFNIRTFVISFIYKRSSFSYFGND